MDFLDILCDPYHANTDNTADVPEGMKERLPRTGYNPEFQFGRIQPRLNPVDRPLH
jgi:hypothetical protein